MYPHLCEAVEKGGLGFDLRQASNAPDLFRELVLGGNWGGRWVGWCFFFLVGGVGGLWRGPLVCWVCLVWLIWLFGWSAWLDFDWLVLCPFACFLVFLFFFFVFFFFSFYIFDWTSLPFGIGQEMFSVLDVSGAESAAGRDEEWSMKKIVDYMSEVGRAFLTGGPGCLESAESLAVHKYRVPQYVSWWFLFEPGPCQTHFCLGGGQRKL